MPTVDLTAYDMPPASGWESHAHADEALLSYAAEGSCTQILARRSWLVLPHHAVWLPPGEAHATQMGPRGCRLKTLSFPVPLPHDLPREPCVIEVSPLLTALIAAFGEIDEGEPNRRGAVRYLIYDEVRRARRLDLGLPRVCDPRLLRVTNALQREPADPRGLEAFARLAGMSRRSFIRHFQAEAGIGFAEWRRRLRLLFARQLLAERASVTETAAALGYGSPSAFIAMVRRELGVTPGELAQAVS